MVETTDSKARAFHAHDGWYFKRIRYDEAPAKSGWVRLSHVPDGQNEPDMMVEFDAETWASIIASVSPDGESGYTYRLAKAVHGIGFD